MYFTWQYLKLLFSEFKSLFYWTYRTYPRKQKVSGDMAMLTHHNKSFLNNSYDNSCVNWGTGGAGEWFRVVEWLYARYFILTYKFYSATSLYTTVIQLFNETAVIFQLPYRGSKLESCFVKCKQSFRLINALFRRNNSSWVGNPASSTSYLIIWLALLQPRPSLVYLIFGKYSV